MSPQHLDRWATAFVDCYRDSIDADPDHPLSWANQEFIEKVFDEPETCWSVILAILEKSPSTHALSMLAAGPLEDLIEMHGADFIDRVEEQARRDPSFRSLLGGVLPAGPPDVWDRVRAARGEAW
jgi:hypothetical protein